MRDLLLKTGRVYLSHRKGEHLPRQTSGMTKIRKGDSDAEQRKCKGWNWRTVHSRSKKHWKELSAVLIITSGSVMVPGIRLSADDRIADRLLRLQYL